MPSALLALAVLLGAAVAALSHGDIRLPVLDVVQAVTGNADTPPHVSAIVWSIRMPRVLTGALVGMALAVAGAIAQAVLRNPLADPGIIGINGGAAVAAMIVIVGFGAFSPGLLSLAGFLGASVMAAAVVGLSWRDGTSSIRIILVGIGLGAVAGGVTTFLAALGDIGDVQRAMIWMAGSLYESDWARLAALAAWTVPGVLAAWLSSHHLDVALLGDTVSRGLGQRVNLARVLLLACCTLLSGAAVAASGLVAFVGLVAPHMARRLVGPRHRILLPVTALSGATLVVLADLAGRTVIAPAQLPVGLTIAMLGAPFFAILMWERRNG